MIRQYHGPDDERLLELTMNPQVEGFKGGLKRVLYDQGIDNGVVAVPRTVYIAALAGFAVFGIEPLSRELKQRITDNLWNVGQTNPVVTRSVVYQGPNREGIINYIGQIDNTQKIIRRLCVDIGSSITLSEESEILERYAAAQESTTEGNPAEKPRKRSLLQKVFGRD